MSDINVNCDVTVSVNDVKLLSLNKEFLKLYSCQISFPSELCNLLCEVSGRKNTHIWPSCVIGLKLDKLSCEITAIFELPQTPIFFFGVVPRDRVKKYSCTSDHECTRVTTIDNEWPRVTRSDQESPPKRLQQKMSVMLLWLHYNVTLKSFHLNNDLFTKPSLTEMLFLKVYNFFASL